ncbi:MAG: acyltransferase family protein [Planctomycetaceae bacterium]|nr:acyltransferase family protein [Planctomycetaceae bacterium]
MHVQHGTRASTAFDALRAAAAFAVFLGHGRSLEFVDHAELPAAGGAAEVLRSGFYLATGFGHQAVLVFFVLSGFFIAQSIRARHRPGATWSFAEYLCDRLARLWVVVLPALLLTAAFDWLSRGWMPQLVTGAYPGNVLQGELQNGVFVLWQNALFLQTVMAPTYGSNGPLWSLANEFWYYVLFPLLLRAAVSPRGRERLVCGALAVLVALLIGPGILVYFPVWLFGAALAYVPRPSVLAVPRWLLVGAPYAAGALAFGALLLARLRPGLSADVALGLAVALWIGAALVAPNAGQPSRSYLARFAGWAASFSFTLYAVHMPLFVLARAWRGPGDPLRSVPDGPSLLRYGATAALIVAFAALLAALTERHTGAARKLLRRVLVRGAEPRVVALNPAPFVSSDQRAA